MSGQINSIADLEQIKNTYNEHTPAYKYQVLVCSGAGCVSSNCAEVRDAVADELYNIGMQGQALLRETGCMGTCAAGRTELDGQIGFAGGNLLKRFCTVAWMLVGLCGVVMFAGESPAMEPDLVYGAVAQRLLPAIMPGLVGIFLAALVASLQSSCDALPHWWWYARQCCFPSWRRMYPAVSCGFSNCRP